MILVLWLFMLKACSATANIPNFDLRGLDPATTGFLIAGESATFFRMVVSTVGDINNDGYADLVIGAPYYDSNRGAVHVIYGGSQSSLSDIDLSSTTLDPATTGFTIRGNAAGNFFGISVSMAGDVDNDGYDDIIIGTDSINTAYVVYGGSTATRANINLATTTLSPTSTGFTIEGEYASDVLGVCSEKILEMSIMMVMLTSL